MKVVVTRDTITVHSDGDEIVAMLYMNADGSLHEDSWMKFGRKEEGKKQWDEVPFTS